MLRVRPLVLFCRLCQSPHVHGYQFCNFNREPGCTGASGSGAPGGIGKRFLIDCHCHLLPGIDDGPETLEESIEMALSLRQLGFTEVYCTPHCIPGMYETVPADVQEGVEGLQRALDGAGIALQLRPGMEYYLDSFFPSRLDAPQTLGSSRLLLVEAPSWADEELVRRNLRQIVRAGLVPLIAHPERCHLMRIDAPGTGLLGHVGRMFSGRGAAGEFRVSPFVAELQKMGCLFQGNIGSFSGRYGRLASQRAAGFLACGGYSCLGSDSHPFYNLEDMLGGGLKKLALLDGVHEKLYRPPVLAG